MHKMTLEYPFGTSKSSLYKAFSTPEGLKEWFADDVKTQDNKEFAIVWNKVPSVAHLVASKENVFVRLQWGDDKEYYFEFRIISQELTGDISLIITDFTSSDEYHESINVWNKQVEKLKRYIGCAKK